MLVNNRWVKIVMLGTKSVLNTIFVMFGTNLLGQDFKLGWDFQGWF
jgi:hypothetical protein